MVVSTKPRGKSRGHPHERDLKRFNTPFLLTAAIISNPQLSSIRYVASTLLERSLSGVEVVVVATVARRLASDRGKAPGDGSGQRSGQPVYASGSCRVRAFCAFSTTSVRARHAPTTYAESYRRWPAHSLALPPSSSPPAPLPPSPHRRFGWIVHGVDASPLHGPLALLT